MVKFEVNGEKYNKIITLPTSVSEITPEYLENITTEILVADNYSLIALCHKAKLSDFILAGRSKKQQLSTQVVPLFVKRGMTNWEFSANIEVADKLLITPTAMSMGLHVNVPMNTLNIERIVAIMEEDKNIYQKALGIKDAVYFLEFKIIPNSDIQGVYKPKLYKEFENPFAIISHAEGGY